MAKRIQQLETPAATSLVARMCYGTTSQLTDYSVLWMGEHLALVRWKGYTYQSVWHPATVWCMSLNGCRRVRSRSSNLASLSLSWRGITRESPLTQAVLDELIVEAAARDHEWPEEMAAAEEKAESKRVREQEQQVAREAVNKAHGALLTAALTDAPEGRWLAWRTRLIEAANQYRTATAAQKKLQEVSDE